LAYSKPEAAEVAGVGLSKIKNAVNDGELAEVEIDSRRLILHDDLQRYLLRHRVVRGNGGGLAAAGPTPIAHGEAEHVAPGNPVLRQRVEELPGLGTRARHVLAAEMITTLGELVCRTPAELLDYPNIGPTVLANIKAALAARGLELSSKETAMR
jgi:hypothetical protein